jgi:hypothetical protein
MLSPSPIGFESSNNRDMKYGEGRADICDARNSNKNKEHFSISIQNSTYKLRQTGFFLEKNFAGYNITCLTMILLCSIADFISIRKMINVPEDNTIYTIAFVAYNICYILTATIAIINTKKRIFEIQVIIHKIFWVVLLGGTFVNIELLRNFPQKENHYFKLFMFLSLIYISVTMFLVTKSKKLKSKMLKTGYLNVPSS